MDSFLNPQFRGHTPKFTLINITSIEIPKELLQYVAKTEFAAELQIQGAG
jgi:hypothetical protein